MDHKTLHELVQALDRLNALAWELNQIGSWLADNPSTETPSDMLEQAARSVLAACWLLERPLRPQPPPERWQGAPDGQQQR
jgi:hypothetical protein